MKAGLSKQWPLAAVCILIVAAYAYMAQSPAWEWQPTPDASKNYYNLVVQGFRSGHLYLKKEVPAGLTQLPDPYDPASNALYRSAPYWMHDLSYYKGRLYLYYGITPVLILFWPFVALTGHYLLHKEAVTVFYAVGFLISVGMLRGMWRRYFAEVNVMVVAACAVALGLAAGAPMLLSWAGVYDVAICCGYMMTTLALGAIWCALHEPEPRKRSWWLALASVAYGLAVGARPTVLFGAVILLVPVAQAWRERRQVWTVLLTATGPIALVGLGLMLYNAQRFGSPFEFGQHYQMSGERQVARHFFRLQYLWFNLRVYFLDPARWSAHFPFVNGIAAPPLPSDYAILGDSYAILTNIPVAWLALATPLTWRNRSEEAASPLRWFVMAVALLFGICALTLVLYESAFFRYEVDFLPPLLLLAVIGILGVEHAAAHRPPVWRNAIRCGWGVLLVFSVAFNLLASTEHYAEGQNRLGGELFQGGNTSEAIRHYQRALWLQPDYAKAHYNLGVALAETGKTTEAIEQYEAALRIDPDFAEAYNNLGVALMQAGRIPEAITHLHEALRLLPDSAVVHYSLGNALLLAGQPEEAIGWYEKALRIDPNVAKVHYNLGLALEQTGRLKDAISHYEQTLRIQPDHAEARQRLDRLRAAH